MDVVRRRDILWMFLMRPWFVFYILWRFSLDYWFSRRPVCFVVGLPAVALLAVPLAVIGWERSKPRWEVSSAYNAAGRRAVEDERYDLARLCFRRMQYLDPTDDAPALGLALLAERQEDTDTVRAIMQRLAGGEHGNAQAHLWLARDMARDKATLSPSQAGQIERHLRQAIAREPRHVDARRMLSRLYIARRDLKRAVETLEPISHHSPFLQVDVARLYRLLGDESQSRREAQQACRVFRERIAKVPADPLLRAGCAEALVHCREFAEATQVLLDGLRECDARHTGDLRELLARTYINWIDSFRESQSDQVRRLQVLEQALRVVPNDAEVVNRVKALSVKRPEDPAFAASLKEILADGRAPAAVHLVLGTSALLRGQTEVGRHHLQLACDGNNKSPVILNNLAWALAKGDEPRLEDARELIDEAVQLDPHHIEIRETRGQILARLGQTRAAINDLEFVLSQEPNRPKVHQTLASLYEQIGDTALAESHRRRAVDRER